MSQATFDILALSHFEVNGETDEKLYVIQVDWLTGEQKRFVNWHQVDSFGRSPVGKTIDKWLEQNLDKIPQLHWFVRAEEYGKFNDLFWSMKTTARGLTKGS